MSKFKSYQILLKMVPNYLLDTPSIPVKFRLSRVTQLRDTSTLYFQKVMNSRGVWDCSSELSTYIEPIFWVNVQGIHRVIWYEFEPNLCDFRFWQIWALNSVLQYILSGSLLSLALSGKTYPTWVHKKTRIPLLVHIFLWLKILTGSVQ